MIWSRRSKEDIPAAHQARTIAYQRVLLAMGENPDVDIDAAFRRILRQTVNTLAVDRAGYWAFDTNSGEICCMAISNGSGENREAMGTVERFPISIFGPHLPALLERTLVAIPDTKKMVHMPALWKALMGRLTIGAVMYVPVSRHGRTSGVLTVACCGNSRPWSAVEKDFAQSVANHLARVLEKEDQRRAEEALRQNEARFRQLVENQSDLIVEIDGRGCFNYVNPNYCMTFGKTEVELLGQPFMRLLSGENQVLALESLQALSTPPYEARHEEHVLTVDGWRWFMWVARAVFDQQGQPAGFITVGRDISERKRAEEDLQESKFRIKAILDSTQQAFVLFDTGGAVKEFNRVAAEYMEQLYGFSMQLGMVLQDRVTAREILLFEKDLGRVLRGENVCLEKQVTGRDGREWWFLLSYHPVRSASGPVTGVLFSAEDITARKRADEERRRLETQVQQAQKLESLGVLAGGIAHDFNNLLLAILGNIDLALMEIGEGHPATITLEESQRSSMRAADLCRQMLAYAGKGRMYVELVDLSAMVREMSGMLGVSLSKKTVVLNRLADGLPPFEADPAQIQQIIMNLIINASESLQELPGQVTVTTGLMHCTREYLAAGLLDEPCPEGDYVFLEVADTGSGMSRDTLERVFEPFFSTKFTGRGLGLAAVLGIVRGHRGALRVDSVPGEGSTFRVLFPAAPLSPRPPEAGKAPVNTGWTASGTVLLVDDEESLRMVGRRMLEVMGFDVVTAGDGREAVEAFHAIEGLNGVGGVRLVILDVAMPEMDGHEALSELRRLRNNVKVILSSGYTEEEVTREDEDSGVAAFIQKPYHLATLQATIKQVLEDCVN